MKINKFLALAMIAMMVIGVTGFVSTKVHARNGTQPVPQAQVTEAPDSEQVAGSDTDNVEEQVGEQVEDGIADGSGAAVTEGSDGIDEVPSSTPAITSDAAIQAAQTYLNTTASGTATLDDENGKLVYSVDLNGSDVKVDAMSGVVLGVDQVGDGQFEGGN
ncbi:MAG: hypothetical protein CVU46_01135 [Chloroflexi bacterium HGW-Chloroflexi-8]|nr:MAG: hypothetical protein CVU46_01135 [Chloroflexi bacterium HGW-Chloroflexi-8]